MKTKISLLLTLFLLLASCQQEMPAVSGGTSTGKGHISFNLATMASGDGVSLGDLDFKSVSSKASAMLDAAENKVNRMDVVIFNASTGAYLSTFTQSTVDVSDFSPTFPSNTRGVACNIYFLANLNAAPAVSTFSESDFKKSNCGLATLVQADVATYGIPMCGSLLGCTIPSDGIITNTPITLTRLLARVDIVYSNIVPTGTLSVQSLQLCNVPSITPYYSPATIDATYYTGMVLANLDPETTTLPAVGVTSTFTYYVPANRRGSDIINPTNIDPRLKNGIGITSPTYVKISGTQVLVDNLPITYTFYLGGNSTTDYNLLANTKYTVNASIKGVSDADSRVVTTKLTLQPPSNCYIVKPGSTIYIPISRAEAGNTALTVASLTGTGFTSSSSFSAGLLWTDDVNSPSHVSADALVGARCIKVVVPSTAAFGNSVVYAYTGIEPGKNIVWSWHIWVTDYAPGATAVATTGGTIDFLGTRYWLDRNLGATSSAPGNLSSLGLYYQWGRKDPFPGAAGVSTSAADNAERPILVIPTITYPGSSSKITNSVAYKSAVASPITTVNQSSYSINYPLLFLTSWTGSIVNSSPTVNNSWGASGGKSIFDPCPSGWRVPIASFWGGLTAANYFKNNPETGPTFYGRQTGTSLNYYPASGRRYYDSGGTVYNVGSYGFYWSGSVNGVKVYTLYFSSGTVCPYGDFGTNDYFRHNGFAVRCIQE